MYIAKYNFQYTKKYIYIYSLHKHKIKISKSQNSINFLPSNVKKQKNLNNFYEK